MIKLSKKHISALAGIALYTVAYQAGKRDAYSSMSKNIDRLETINQNIGYLRAMEDLIKKYHK